jgi:hypothetical protein
MDLTTIKLVVINFLIQTSDSLVNGIKAMILALLLFLLGLSIAALSENLLRKLFRSQVGLGMLQRLGWTWMQTRWLTNRDLGSTLAEVVYWLIFIHFTLGAFIVSDLAGLRWLGRAYFDLLPELAKSLVIFGFAGVVAFWVKRLLIWIQPNPEIWKWIGLCQAVVFTLAGYSVLINHGFDRDLSLYTTLICLTGAMVGIFVKPSAPPPMKRIPRDSK